ncbi:MAG: type IX secretion system membrane protein PorP/SprF [Spirosomataceae bacterium]
MRYIFLFLVYITTTRALAQQPLLDIYPLENIGLNPAFTGSRGYFNLSGVLGNQLNGTFRPAQVSQVLTADALLINEKSGISFQGFNSSAATFVNSGIKVNYARVIDFEGFQVRAGASVGGRFRTFFNGNFDNRQFIDPIVGFGILVNTDDFYVGASSPAILVKGIALDPRMNPFILSFAAVKGNSNLLAHVSGHLFRGTNARSTSPFGAHITTKIWFQERFAVGLSAQADDSPLDNTTVKFKPIFLAELRVTEGVRLGASYDAKPLSLYRLSTGIVQNVGLFQVFFRYEGVKNGVKKNVFEYH